MTTAYYDDGTISVANGGTVYTGVGTAFQTADLRAGDKLIKNGLTIRLTADPSSETSFTGEPWPGTALVGATYAIEYQSEGSRLTAALYALLQTIADTGNLESLGGLVLAANKGLFASGPGVLDQFDLPALARQFLAAAGASSSQLTNVGLKASVGANALTIELKQKDGATNCDATKPVIIGFRDATLANGDFLQRTVTGALSIIIPSGATMGQTNAVAANLYLYALDNAGTVELAVAGKDFGDGGRISTTIMNTSSDAADTMYSTTGRSNVAFRKIALLVNTQATAGTWATAPSNIQLAPYGELETETFKALKDDTSFGAMLTSLGFSAFIQTLIDDGDAATVRSTIGAPAAASGTHTGTTSIETIQLAGNYYLQLLSGTTPLINFDSNDNLQYDRTNNKLVFSVNGAAVGRWGNVLTTEANIVTALTATISNGAQQNLPTGSGLLVINATNLGGSVAAFVIGGGVVTKLGGSSLFVSGAPGAGFIGVEWTGSVYRINNNQGGSADIAKYLVHTRLAN